MRKTNIASFISAVSLFDIFMLVIQWMMAMPGLENAYGYYNDGYDITRFKGTKGMIFNWFSNLIEPVTEGHLETFSQFIPVLLFFLWMIISGFLAGIIFNDKEYSKKCPWMFIIVQAVISVYWAAYIGFVWLR
jgi:hypothetical protein